MEGSNTGAKAKADSAAPRISVAPRMPSRPYGHTGSPWTVAGDIVVDCDKAGCGWHAFGPRGDVHKAWQEHYRQWHGSAQEIGVVLLNRPRQ